MYTLAKRFFIVFQRTAATLYSYPRNDLPGGISSKTSHIIHSFNILLYTLINNYLCSRKSKNEDNTKQILKKGLKKILSRSGVTTYRRYKVMTGTFGFRPRLEVVSDAVSMQEIPISEMYVFS